MADEECRDFNVEIGPPPLYEPLIRWLAGRGYALIELGRGGLPVDLPGRRMTVTDEDVLGESDTLLLSERCGGSRDLLKWWCHRLDEAGRPWVLVHAAHLASQLFQWGREVTAEQKEVASPAINSLLSDANRTQRIKALVDWANPEKLPSDFTLIIRDLMMAGQENGIEVATALRTIRDQHLAPKLQIVLLSHSESTFQDRYDRSGYLSLLRQFRLPKLEAHEIGRLAAKRAGPDEAGVGLILEGAARDHFMDQTGGQPLLVQHLLRRLRQLAEGPITTVSVADVEQAGHHLRQSQPEQVAQWQEDLRRLLEQQPEMMATMKAYLLGQSLGPSRFPPPHQDRPLFIAGWVGVNRLGRWGIASEYHAHLAGPVMDELLEEGS